MEEKISSPSSLLREKRNTRDTLERTRIRRRMSSRLWASLKARSQRNHGGDGPRPVLQPRRVQVCQWRRCVCGVCFCASSRSDYFIHAIETHPRISKFRTDKSSVLSFFFSFSFLIYERRKEWKLIVAWSIRGVPSFAEKRFSTGEDFMEHQSERWVVSFRSVILTAAYNHPPNDAIDRIENSILAPSRAILGRKENPSFREIREDSADGRHPCFSRRWLGDAVWNRVYFTSRTGYFGKTATISSFHGLLEWIVGFSRPSSQQSCGRIYTREFSEATT